MLPHFVFQIIVQYLGLEQSIKKRTGRFLYHTAVYEINTSLEVYAQPFRKFLLEFDLLSTAMRESYRFPGYTGYTGPVPFYAING